MVNDKGVEYRKVVIVNGVRIGYFKSGARDVSLVDSDGTETTGRAYIPDSWSMKQTIKNRKAEIRRIHRSCGKGAASARLTQDVVSVLLDAYKRIGEYCEKTD